MQSSSLPSRIRDSAAGLAKELFSNSAHGASETTSELATLRSVHKLSSATSSHGTSSSSRLPKALPKALSNRHKNATDYSRSSRYSADFDSSEANDEFSGFLLQECDIGESSTSSSRSGSDLDLTLTIEDGSVRRHASHLKRNDSFEPEVSRSRSKQKSPAQSIYKDIGSSQEGYYLKTSSLCHYDQNDHFEQSSTKFSRDQQQGLPLGHSDKSVSVMSSSDADATRRKERALSRLQLIFSQMPAVTQVERHTILDQRNAFESSYNQLCGGEDAQEWAEFEASLFHAYSMQDNDQVHAQTQQQETSAATGRQGNMHGNGLMQNLQQPKEVVRHVQNQAAERSQDQSKDKAPLLEFHCPWIDCHSVCSFT